MEDLLDDPFHSASNPARIPGRRRLRRRRRPRRPVVPGSAERRPAGRPWRAAGRGTGRRGGERGEGGAGREARAATRGARGGRATRRGRSGRGPRPLRCVPGLGRRNTLRRDGRRLGAGDRGGSVGAMGLRTRHSLRRGQAVPRQLPDAVHRAADQQRRRRDVRTVEAAVRVQGRRPVRPDHRGCPADGQRLRAVHERLQRGLREVDRPRRDMERAGQDVRERELERQAGHRRER